MIRMIRILRLFAVCQILFGRAAWGIRPCAQQRPGQVAARGYRSATLARRCAVVRVTLLQRQRESVAGVTVRCGTESAPCTVLRLLP